MDSCSAESGHFVCILLQKKSFVTITTPKSKFYTTNFHDSSHYQLFKMFVKQNSVFCYTCLCSTRNKKSNWNWSKSFQINVFAGKTKLSKILEHTVNRMCYTLNILISKHSEGVTQFMAVIHSRLLCNKIGLILTTTFNTPNRNLGMQYRCCDWKVRPSKFNIYSFASFYVVFINGAVSTSVIFKVWWLAEPDSVFAYHSVSYITCPLLWLPLTLF